MILQADILSRQIKLITMDPTNSFRSLLQFITEIRIITGFTYVYPKHNEIATAQKLYKKFLTDTENSINGLIYRSGSGIQKIPGCEIVC
jgi:hypothetical protein